MNEIPSGNEELMTADDYLQPQQWADKEVSAKSDKVGFDVFVICL